MKINSSIASNRIPEKGRPKAEVLQQLSSFSRYDPHYKAGKTWSLVYFLGEAFNSFLLKAYGLYFSANGLNPMAFKSLKRLESDIISMTASLLNGDDETCGVLTAGGTESCLLAVKTYRDYARDKKGIKKPEMVIPNTAHVAWEKAAHYFGVTAKRAPLKGDFTLDVDAYRKLITRNTVMLLGSAPEYPHGMIDPISELGELAEAYNIPLHIDSCVGGFILPFIEQLGYDLEPWDYRVKGVTSISADIHKYGFAAKGASTITYRSKEYFKYQIFVYENWPGGIFASPGILGTRPGGAYSAAWAALQSMGMNGYRKNAKNIMAATESLRAGINKIKGLKVCGHPTSGLLSYMSTDKDLNIYAVADIMESKGWHIDRLQRPEALHAMVTPGHVKVTDQYLKDLKMAVKKVREYPELGETGGAATYGMIANIPLRSMVKKNVLNIMTDMYAGGKIFDPADGTGSMEDEQGKMEKQGDLSEKIAMTYLKVMKRFKK